MTRTGTSIPGSADHSGRWLPVPASSRLRASPSAVLRRRSSSNLVAGGSPANIGWASHEPTNQPTPLSRIRAARAWSCSRRSGAAASSMPGVPPTRTRPRTAAGTSVATCRAMRAPIE